MKKIIRFPFRKSSHLILLMVIQVILIHPPDIIAQITPRIFINEFLSANRSINPDMVDFGDFSDWIELYNDENSSVNIGGFYLTDDLTQPLKWRIPDNTIIPSKGFYLIWADGYNDVPGKTYLRSWWPGNIQFTTKWCHTNFKLNKDADELGLYDAFGNKLDSLVFSNQVLDVSYGRKPDGSSSWYYFGEPTPSASNSTTGISTTDISANVNFSADGGFYQSSVQVILSSSNGNGIIRYTTDGLLPKSTSAQYLNPLTISSNTVLRARVFENSKLPGKVTTNSYFINETRNLPVVSLVTNPAFLWDRQLGIYLNSYKDREIPVSIEYFPLNSGRAFSLNAGAGIGGENIYRFAQKPFNIYMRSDYGQAHLNYKIFDDLPYKDYDELYLRNSGSDWTTTMFRDGLIVNILKNKILNTLQDYKPAVMYLNGQYWGINNIREKVNDQFLLMHYNVDKKDLDHIDDSYRVLSGDSADYVNLLNFADANNLSDASNYNYVASRINIDDLIDFIIVQDYIANSSWGHNREMWRDKKNEKLWRWVLVDMDRGFDAARITVNQLADIFNNFDLFRQLCNNNNFKNEFIQRYSEHLNHTFSNDRVVNLIDSIKSLIENEMPRHIQKWGTLIDSLSIDGGFGKHPGVISMSYWNQEVEKLKTFSAQRPAYAVQYLNDRFGLSGRANLKITSSVQKDAKLEINGFYETIGDSNLYFKNIPLSIKAYAPPGYRFKQWVDLKSGGNVIGTEPENNYTLSGDAELMMEFEKLGTGEVPEVLDSALTLYKSGSPYFIINDLNIGTNGILTVEPGVVIYFSSNKSIYVKGRLLMEGTEAEPITLLPYFAEEKWGAVCFDKSNGTSELNYVNISGSTNGNDTVNFFAAVSSLESSVNLNHVHFNNVKLPVSAQFSNMVIDNCILENVTYVGDYVNATGGNLSILNSVFTGNDIEDMDAVDIGSMIGTTEIKNNIFRDFTGSNSDGVDLGENSINVAIENNLITNCFDKGISIGRGSNALISHNIIAKCGMGVGIKDSLSDGNIVNCTFYKNDIGVDCFEKELNRGGGSAVIKNSIFANSSQAPFSIDDESRINISYSLSNTSALPGQGNILAEPLMINPNGLNFHLQTASPCIDKGDPQSPADNDGTRSDIGAYMYAGVSEPAVVINEINYNSSSSFDPDDWIELCNAAKEAIDISGWVFMDENRTPSFVMNPGTVLQPDSYIVITKDSKLFNSIFPTVNNYAGDMSNGLSGGGEALFLYDTSGRLVDSLTYDNKSPWPRSPDGGGTTLELKNPGLENSLAANWSASSGHGTPGSINSDYIAGVKKEQNNIIPKEFLLSQNYPNPFNPSTKIKFELPENSIVHLTIFNILGKQVAEIAKGEFSPGIYSIEWDGSSFASGIYLLKMNAQSTSGKNYSSVKKLVLLK
ncbi:MAG TPA: CotH kinase family protein [Ignavibacteriaceae bacterium]|nr:CotH kinase family protein [Ignavibacteriaceae bacterium]